MRDPLICSCYCNVNCVFLCLGLLPGWLEMFISSVFAALRLLSQFRESLCSLRLSALRRNRCRDCFNIQLEGFKQCWDGHVSPSLLLFSSLFSTSISVLFLLQLKCNTSLTLLRMSVHLLSFCICFLSFRQTVMTHIRWVFGGLFAFDLHTGDPMTLTLAFWHWNYWNTVCRNTFYYYLNKASPSPIVLHQVFFLR